MLVSTEQINRVRSLSRYSAATATLSMVGNAVHSFSVCDSVRPYVDVRSQKHGFGGPRLRALAGFCEGAMVVWECRMEHAWAGYPVILPLSASEGITQVDVQAVPACGGRQSIDGAAIPCKPYATCLSWSAESVSVMFPDPRQPRS